MDNIIKRAAYKNFFAGIIVMVMTYGITSTLPMFFPAMAQTYGTDATVVSLLLTVSGVAAFVSTFASGWIIKKLKMKLSMTLGMILVAIPCYLFYIATDMTLVYVGAIIQGLAGAVAINV